MITVLEFSRGHLRISTGDVIVRVLGEMTVDPLGFVVFDQLPVMSENGVELMPEDVSDLHSELRSQFLHKDRRFWLESELAE